MRTWPASLFADLNALAAGWSSLRGGWQTAWRDAAQFLEHRRIVVDTLAQTPDGSRVVLRTRLRLNGDAETDILRSWIERTPRRSLDALAETHFQSVADAARGWSVAAALSRLISHLTVLFGMILGMLPAIRSALETGSSSPIPALLTNWWILSGLVTVAVGILFRRVFRVWLRWKFYRGLAIGP
jgi:hypothetical protein